MVDDRCQEDISELSNRIKDFFQSICEDMPVLDEKLVLSTYELGDISKFTVSVEEVEQKLASIA